MNKSSKTNYPLGASEADELLLTGESVRSEKRPVENDTPGCCPAVVARAKSFNTIH